MKGESKRYEQRAVSGVTPLTPILANPAQSEPSAIAAFQASRGSLVLPGESLSCESAAQTPKSFPTLGADSTTNGVDSTPYWNALAAESASNLWLPAPTDSLGSGWNSSKVSSSAAAGASWFSTKSRSAPGTNPPPTFSQSSQRSACASTDFVAAARKSRKIRLYPNANQRRTLKQWLGAARWFYNKAIELLTTGEDPPKAVKVKVKQAILADAPEWAKDVPREVKAGAIFDACRAVSAVKRNNKGKKRGDDGFAENKFRSRKKPAQSFTVQANCYSNDGVYTAKLGAMRLAERLPASDGKPAIARLIRHNGRWFLNVPYDEKARSSLSENQAGMVGIDMGVRTFASYYADDGAGKVGDGDFGRVQRLCSHLDRLLSRIALRRKTGKSVRSMRRAADRLRWKIRDLVDELHKNLADRLTRRYAVIAIGDLQTKRLSEKSKRKLRRKSVRAMLTWAHYRFRQHLLHKAAERGVRALVVNEAYTSKTCSNCGWVKRNLGGAKAWTCSGCGVRHDRDINGARGIYLRALGDTPVFDSFGDAPVSQRIVSVG